MLIDFLANPFSSIRRDWSGAFRGKMKRHSKGHNNREIERRETERERVMCTSTRAIPICSIPAAASSVAPSPPSSVACSEKDRERRIRTRGEGVSGNRRRKKKKTEERGRVRE
jgi:hypothetical protein